MNFLNPIRMRKSHLHQMLFGSKEFIYKRCAATSSFPPTTSSAIAPIKSPGVPACFMCNFRCTSRGCWLRSRTTGRSNGTPASLCGRDCTSSVAYQMGPSVNTGNNSQLSRSVWMQCQRTDLDHDDHVDLTLNNVNPKDVENKTEKGKSVESYGMIEHFLDLEKGMDFFSPKKISKKMYKSSVTMVGNSYPSLAFCHLPVLNPGLCDRYRSVITKCQIISRTFRTCSGGIAKDLEDRKDDMVQDESDENMDEWIHPDDRSDIILEQDPELKSLLRELASDFGKEKPDGNTSEAGRSHTGTISTSENKEEESNAGAKLDGNFKMKIFDTSVGEAKTLEPISAEKGEQEKKFVFSIDDLVSILREENAQDICVINIPKEKQYVDYFVVVTGRSPRHLKAMALHINQQYKSKKSKEDPYVLVEGEDTDDWICIDFGNIVLHLMSEETREFYELEKLWTLGPEYDDQLRRLKEYERKMQETLDSVDLARTGNQEQKRNGDGRPVISYAR